MKEVTVPSLEVSAPNTAKVYLPTLTMFFSYTTCVGFRSNKHGYVFTDKTYSNTTARHMKSVFMCNKEDKVPHEEFEAKLQEALWEVYTNPAAGDYKQWQP